MTRMVDVLGKPDDHLLTAGKYTPMFFNKNHSWDYSRWSLKVFLTLFCFHLSCWYYFNLISREQFEMVNTFRRKYLTYILLLQSPFELRQGSGIEPNVMWPGKWPNISSLDQLETVSGPFLKNGKWSEFTFTHTQTCMCSTFSITHSSHTAQGHFSTKKGWRLGSNRQINWTIIFVSNPDLPNEPGAHCADRS